MKFKENERHYPDNLLTDLQQVRDYFSIIAMNLYQVFDYIEKAEPTKMELNTIAKGRSDMTFVRARLSGLVSALEQHLQKAKQEMFIKEQQ